MLLRTLLLLLLLSTPALAQDVPAPEAEGAVPAEAPAEIPASRPAPPPASIRTAIPVGVVHQGEDPLGIQLAFALKETFAASPLFRLAGPEDKRILVRLASRAEFPGRPALASCYGLTWVYAEKSDVLAFFLEDGAGLTMREEVDDTAKSIAATTDAVADRFSYLFE